MSSKPSDCTFASKKTFAREFIDTYSSGAVISDASSCVMWKDQAIRIRCAGLQTFAEELDADGAIGLEALNMDLLDNALGTKHRPSHVGDSAAPHLTSRTSGYFSCRGGEPTRALFDVGTKGVSETARYGIDEQLTQMCGLPAGEAAR